MTQISKQATVKSLPLARNPRQAQRRRAAIDRLLDTDLFKALADPTRVKLLACLIKCGRPCSVSEVADCCAVDFSVVARHLAQLARVGILSAEKKGRTMWYTPCCSDVVQRLRALAAAIEEWCPNTAAESPATSGANCCENPRG